MHPFRSLMLAWCIIALLYEVQDSRAQIPDNGSQKANGELFQHLTTAGVQFPSGMSVVLKLPSLRDSSDASARRAVLENIAAGIGWDRFSRDSHVAPIEIDLQYLKNESGDRVGHLVYVAFVAYIDTEHLRDPEKLKSFFQSSADNLDADRYRANEASAEELANWGIADKQQDTSYLEFRLPLLDRILLEGWLQVQRTDNRESIMLTWLVDPRFNSSEMSSETSRRGNRWALLASRAGDSAASDGSHPYQGAAGYMHITPLDQPAGASLVEARMVIHEPTEWFRGSNLLRSKLPLMIQESVRTFRRKWSERQK